MWAELKKREKLNERSDEINAYTCTFDTHHIKKNLFLQNNNRTNTDRNGKKKGWCYQ